MRSVRSLVLTIATFILLFAAPTVQAQNPPKGDNVANPVKIALNTQKTVKNIQNASVESPATENTSCDGDDNSDHSVWFRFVMPAGGTVDLDSGGSILNGSTGSHAYVVLTLYRETAGLAEVACMLSTNARLVSQNLTAGVYFVRIANDSITEPTAPSQYRLSLRLRSMNGLLQDPSFENEALGVSWKAKKAGSPAKVTRVCTTECQIRFGGAAKGQVFQRVSIDTKSLRFKVGDVVSADAFINNTPIAGADVKLTLQIVYADSTPATQVSLTRHITQTGTSVVKGFGSIFAEIRSKAVESIKFTITSPDASETFSVTSTGLTIQAGTSVRALPLPPAP
jgi:hypothetical protein